MQHTLPHHVPEDQKNGMDQLWQVVQTTHATTSCALGKEAGGGVADPARNE